MGLTGDEYGFAQPMAYTPALPAFEDLLKRHRTDLRSFVARRVTDLGLVDDIVQDTLLRAYRARAGFDGRRPVWPWLATIAKNTILNTLRGEKVRRSHLDRETDWRAVEGYADPRLANDPAKRYASKEQRAAIAEALAALDHRQRKVLLMRAAEGKSYEEIARAEGLSIDAVKSLLKRTRRTFRERYDGLAPGREVPSFLPLLAGVRNRMRVAYRRARGRVDYTLQFLRSTPGLESTAQALIVASVAGALFVTGLSGRATDPSPSGAAQRQTVDVQAEAVTERRAAKPSVTKRSYAFRKTITSATPKGTGALSLAGEIDRTRPERRSVRVYIRYKIPGQDEGANTWVDVPCTSPVAGGTPCDAVDAMQPLPSPAA